MNALNHPFGFPFDFSSLRSSTDTPDLKQNSSGPCCVDRLPGLALVLSFCELSWMPYKFNDARRDTFSKAKYQVTNCSEYNESLRRRGDVTIWVSDDVVQNWRSPRRKTRGGQSRYSDLAIEICLTLRVVFRLPLRQTQGFMRSITKLMGMDIVVPVCCNKCYQRSGIKP